jgi:peroxiredoxin
MDKKTGIIIIVLLAAVGTFHYHLKKSPNAASVGGNPAGPSFQANAGPGKGSPAPDFKLRLIDGTDFRLADQIGKKVIVLNFFATWCGPCMGEMPGLADFYNKNSSLDMIMVGIDMSESEDLVRQCVKDNNIGFPIGIDSAGTIFASYGVSGIPVTVLIGADGRIEFSQVGSMDDAEATLGPVLRAGLESLAQKKISAGAGR